MPDGAGDPPVGVGPELESVPRNRLHELAEEFETETPTRRLTGWGHRLVTLLALSLSSYALYWVIGIVQPQIYRVSFLLIALVLTFLVYPAGRAWRSRITPLDWALAGLAVAALSWPIADFERFVYRAATPTRTDLALGTVAVILVLEATRRTVGPILPVTAIVFIAYGYLGPLLDLVGLSLFAHRGYALDRLIGTLYMTLEGLFGVPLDVASTYIILFTIYGAVLEFSGARAFFLAWAMTATSRSSSGSAAGRTVAATADVRRALARAGGRVAADVRRRAHRRRGPSDGWSRGHPAHRAERREAAAIVSRSVGSLVAHPRRM